MILNKFFKVEWDKRAFEGVWVEAFNYGIRPVDLRRGYLDCVAWTDTSQTRTSNSLLFFGQRPATDHSVGRWNKIIRFRVCSRVTVLPICARIRSQSLIFCL